MFATLVLPARTNHITSHACMSGDLALDVSALAINDATCSNLAGAATRPINDSAKALLSSALEKEVDPWQVGTGGDRERVGGAEGCLVRCPLGLVAGSGRV